MIPNLDQIKQTIDNATNILIIQADNPDGDSLGSALALEQIIGDMGKHPTMYCGVSIPDYLKFMPGWDRVSADIPAHIDASIIVDTSAHLLLEQLEKHPGLIWIAAKPVIVLDHHNGVECDIPYAKIICNAEKYASTGELIYDLANELKWSLSTQAQEYILQSILSDTLGLTSEATTAQTYRRIADMIDNGVSRTKLEEARRSLSKMHLDVFRYKSDLIKRVEFYGTNNEIAIITIPEDELYTVGTLYNPAPLILNEVSMVEGVRIGIVIKHYKNKFTGAIRCNDGARIASKIAEKYGGGGHPYAAGFKIEKPNINLSEIKSKIISDAIELLQ